MWVRHIHFPFSLPQPGFTVYSCPPHLNFLPSGVLTTFDFSFAMLLSICILDLVHRRRDGSHSMRPVPVCAIPYAEHSILASQLSTHITPGALSIDALGIPTTALTGLLP